MPLLIGFILLGTSFFVSSHFLPWTGFHHETLAGMGGILIGVQGVRAAGATKWPPLAWFALAAAAIPLAQWYGGLLLFRGDAVIATLYLLTFALSVASGAQLARSDRDNLFDGLATTLLAAALGSAAIASSQWLSVELPLPHFVYEPFSYGGRVVANLGQPNQLADCLALGLVSLCWLRSRGKVSVAAQVGAAGVLGLALAATQSRTGWAIVVVLTAWYFYARRRVALPVSVLGIATFVVYYFSLFHFWDALSATLQTAPTRGLDGTGVGTRPLHWNYMLNALQLRPWSGYGWGELTVGVGQIAASMPPVHEMTDFAHTLPLDLLMWNGIPLGLAMIVGLAAWVVWHICHVRHAATAFALAIVATIGMHALVEFPHAYVYFLIPLGLMMGAADVVSGQPAWRPLHRAGQWTLMAIAFGTAAVVALDYTKIDRDHREMRLSYMGLAPRKPPESAPHVLVLDHMRAFLVLARTPLTRTLDEREFEFAARTVSRFPHPSLLLTYGLAAARRGDTVEALRAVDLLCKLHTVAHCEDVKNDWRLATSEEPEVQRLIAP